MVWLRLLARHRDFSVQHAIDYEPGRSEGRNCFLGFSYRVIAAKACAVLDPRFKAMPETRVTLGEFENRRIGDIPSGFYACADGFVGDFRAWIGGPFHSGFRFTEQGEGVDLGE